MLKREFRRKYSNNPDEGIGYKGEDFCNRTYSSNPTNKYYRSGYPSIVEVRKEYCALNSYDYHLYMKDWRSIERINPTTKKFYKSKKYQ